MNELEWVWSEAKLTLGTLGKVNNIIGIRQVFLSSAMASYL